MVKTIAIIQKIGDLQEFEKIFFEKCVPCMLEIPGVIDVEITSVFPMSKDNAKDIESMQLIVETHYETYEDIKNGINSLPGQRFLEFASVLPSGKFSLFMGKEKKLYPFRPQLENYTQDMNNK